MIYQIKNINYEVNWIRWLACVNGQSVAINEIRLVKIENFNVVRKYFSSNISNETKRVFPCDFVKFYVVAELCEVNFVV